jgi:hypothetical protein
MIRSSEPSAQAHPGRIPIVVLAGSDRKMGFTPAAARGMTFVVGYKGADLRFGGRPLADLLVERVRRSGAFGEVYLAGPRRIYDGLVACPIIDTDGHIGENIQAAVRHIRGRHGDQARVALIACDILPSAGEIRELADLLADGCLADPPPSRPGARPPAALAISIIRADQDLGASSWKPKYGVRPAPGADPIPVLPGHLGIAWPSRLRMGLLHRLFSLAYRERNRGYSSRRRAILLRIVGTLLRRDLLNVLRLQPPTLTWSVLRHGLGTYSRWRRGTLDLEGFALGVGAVLVRRQHFRRERANAVRVVTSGLLSFAKDLDTVEECAELERRVAAEGVS